jgi:hypothetical protein
VAAETRLFTNERAIPVSRADLDFVCDHADLVALSFVSTVDDVRELRTLLQSKGGRQPAIVLKIETRRGFDNQPAMLLEAMKGPCCAVMIARGDLAVERGFERMAEVQGGDSLALRGGARTCDMGDPSARDAREGGRAIPRRGHRRSDGEPR